MYTSAQWFSLTAPAAQADLVTRPSAAASCRTAVRTACPEPIRSYDNRDGLAMPRERDLLAGQHALHDLRQQTARFADGDVGGHGVSVEALYICVHECSMVLAHSARSPG